MGEGSNSRVQSKAAQKPDTETKHIQLESEEQSEIHCMGDMGRDMGF